MPTSSRRWPGGAAAELFAANGISADNPHVNVQPLSGAPANSIGIHALLQPGDTILVSIQRRRPSDSRVARSNRSGKVYQGCLLRRCRDGGTGLRCYRAEGAGDRSRKSSSPAIQAYPKIIDWKRFREIADKVGPICWPTSPTFPGRGRPPQPHRHRRRRLVPPKRACAQPRQYVDDPPARPGLASSTAPSFWNRGCARQYHRRAGRGPQAGPHRKRFRAPAAAHRRQRRPAGYSSSNSTVSASPGGGCENHLLLIDTKSVTHDGVHLTGDMGSRILDVAGIVANRVTQFPATRARCRLRAFASEPCVDQPVGLWPRGR